MKKKNRQTIHKDLSLIRQFVALVSQTDISELEWEKNGFKIGFRKGAGKTQENHSPLQLGQAADNTAGAENTSADSGKNGLVRVLSSMVGTFFHSANPDQKSYVHVGDTVKKGQKVCVIEAMKIMKEVTAPVEGKVVKILVHNGVPVEYGQSLMMIEPSKSAHSKREKERRAVKRRNSDV